MQRSRYNLNRLDVWGDSLLNKLPSRSRKRRKRQANKKRCVLLRLALSGGGERRAILPRPGGTSGRHQRRSQFANSDAPSPPNNASERKE